MAAPPDFATALNRKVQDVVASLERRKRGAYLEALEVVKEGIKAGDARLAMDYLKFADPGAIKSTGATTEQGILGRETTQHRLDTSLGRFHFG